MDRRYQYVAGDVFNIMAVKKVTDTFDKCRMHEKQRHHINHNRNDSSIVSCAGCLTGTDYPFLKGVIDVRCHKIAVCTIFQLV